MPGCLHKCPGVDDLSSLETTWSGVRDHYGPRPASLTEEGQEELYNIDLEDFQNWAVDYGRDPYNTRLFKNHLNWKLSVGSTNYGNLSTRIRDHVGISCVPCPYSTDSSDERTEDWLNDDDPRYTHVDHDIYYMRVASRGTAWGYECTYSGCPYEADRGLPYFHV